MMTEDHYRRDLAAKGYADPVEKTWEAGLFNDTHDHAQALYLRIATDEMTLEVEGENGSRKVTIGPGETIEVPGGCRHSERAGPQGVTFLVASR